METNSVSFVLLCNLIGIQSSIIWNVSILKVQTLMKGFNPLFAASPVEALSTSVLVFSYSGAFREVGWMSLELLLNAAVFQQLLNEGVRLLSLSLMHHSVSPSSFRVLFFLFQHIFGRNIVFLWQLFTDGQKMLTLNRQEMSDMEMDILALLFY